MSAHPSQLLGNTSDRNLGCTGVRSAFFCFSLHQNAEFCMDLQKTKQHAMFDRGFDER